MLQTGCRGPPRGKAGAVAGEGPPELLDKEKYRGIGHDKSAPGGMAEIGLTNSSVTNSPITPIPCLQLLTHNCLGQKGKFSWVSNVFELVTGLDKLCKSPK